MFGSNDKDQTNNTQQDGGMAAGPLPLAPVPEDSLSQPPADPVITPSAPPLNDSLASAKDEPVLPPLEPTPSIIKNSSDTSGQPDKPADMPAPAPGAHDDELFDIKQQALHNLAPLVDHLDQSPEEKFKTTMMLIQASDNASLIKDAYDAANAIGDEKARAQALLDVVNEINYFTQHPSTGQN